MRYKRLIVSLLLLVLLLTSAIADAPVYEGHVATEINGGVPTFTYEEIRTAEGISSKACESEMYIREGAFAGCPLLSGWWVYWD